MPEVVCQVTRWVDDEPQPGTVEAVIVDAFGQHWTFIDKWPIFLTDLDDRDFPKTGVVRCVILEVFEDQSGRSICNISTELPDHVCAVESDQIVFEVNQEQLVISEFERTS